MFFTNIEDVKNSIPYEIDVCVSFVLFNTNKQEIERAIHQALNANVKTHVVIIDNSQPPLDLDTFSDKKITIVTTGKNIGYGRGHNIALEASKGKCQYNLVMNTDLIMGSKVLPDLVNFMDINREVGLTMPKVIYPDGKLQRLCRLLPNPLDLIGRRFFGNTKWAKRRNRIYEFHNWNYDSIAEFPFLSGCFMLIRRSTLDKIGYFDERYFLYAEDLDLSRRLHKVSKTLFVPSQTIVHEYRSQTKPSLRRLKYATVSLIRYFNKWGWVKDKERDVVNARTCSQFD